MDNTKSDNVLDNVIAAALKDFDFKKYYEQQAKPHQPKPLCTRCKRREKHDGMSLCLTCSYF